MNCVNTKGLVKSELLSTSKFSAFQKVGEYLAMRRL